MQRITFIGNVSTEPESRSTQSGVTVCAFNVAVNRKFNSPDGQKQTDFFRVSAWRGLGETCAKYLSKGKKVAVTGELQARMYEDKQGKARMSLDVSADEVEFLTPKSDAPTELTIDSYKDVPTDGIPF